MATKEQLQKEMNLYKGKILELRKQAVNCIKSGNAGPEYGQLILQEQFYGSLIKLNAERLEKMSSSL